MTDFQSLINKSIKALRIKQGLSQEKFSELCNLSSDNYRNLEYNRHTPSSATINKICDTFNLSPIELLRFANDKRKTKELLIESLTDLTENQEMLLIDFIKLIKQYEP